MRLNLKPFLHREPGGGFEGDSILIEVLESGDIKITTDPISGPNHSSAENMLRVIAEIAGGHTHKVRRRVTHGKTKQHQHIHEKS